MTRRPSRALSGAVSCVLSLLLGAAPAAALAQSYRFPASDAHYGYFYPTAYVDEGGSDWNCGSIYYGGHQGSDFGIGSWSGMDEGRAVVAAADGVVIATNDGEFDRCETADCGEANYVILEHADGRRTWYWHLKQWTVAVGAGQVVTCGTHLGYAGSSGNSTGPHLHFEVREASGGMGDPFDGPCSAPPTYWISQGDYGGLPGVSCPYTGPCVQVDTLSCGETLASANNAGGATSSHSVYGCGTSASSGPEIAYAFSTTLSEPVTLGLTGLGGDLDLFLQSADTCDGSGAITCSTNSDASEEWITFDAAAGATYTVVVDGWDGAVSGFNLSASCVGGSTTDGGDDGGGDGAPDSAIPDSGQDTAATGGFGPRPTEGRPPGGLVPLSDTASEGCGGCAASPTGAGGRALGLLSLALGLGLAAARRRPSAVEHP